MYRNRFIRESAQAAYRKRKKGIPPSPAYNVVVKDPSTGGVIGVVRFCNNTQEAYLRDTPTAHNPAQIPYHLAFSAIDVVTRNADDSYNELKKVYAMVAAASVAYENGVYSYDGKPIEVVLRTRGLKSALAKRQFGVGVYDSSACRFVRISVRGYGVLEADGLNQPTAYNLAKYINGLLDTHAPHMPHFRARVVTSNTDKSRYCVSAYASMDGGYAYVGVISDNNHTPLYMSRTSADRLRGTIRAELMRYSWRVHVAHEPNIYRMHLPDGKPLRVLPHTSANLFTTDVQYVHLVVENVDSLAQGWGVPTYEGVYGTPHGAIPIPGGVIELVKPIEAGLI